MISSRGERGDVLLNPQRKAAAVYVAMVLVALPTLILIWFTIATLGDAPLGDRFPGKFLLAVGKGGGLAMDALKSLPLLITFSLSFLIPKGKVDWRFVATVVAALVGLLCAVYLYFALQDGDTAHRLWSYSTFVEMDSPAAVRENLLPRVLALAGWYLATLCVQCGMKLRGGDGGE